MKNVRWMVLYITVLYRTIIRKMVRLSIRKWFYLGFGGLWQTEKNGCTQGKFKEKRLDGMGKFIAGGGRLYMEERRRRAHVLQWHPAFFAGIRAVL